MRVLSYFVVLLITAGSVAFGLDWASAPMSPMPAARPALYAASKPAPQVETSGVKPAAEPVQAASQAEPPPAPVVAIEPVAPKVEVAAPVSKCDVTACTAAYRSFTAADCTYQPFDGPRRLCEKGTPPAAAAAAPVTPAPDARAQAACNVAACSQSYISFTASDCTYQPMYGSRRLCEK